MPNITRSFTVPQQAGEIVLTILGTSREPTPHMLPVCLSAALRGGVLDDRTLTVMVLMFVVMGAIYGIWFGLQRSYSYTEDDMGAQREAQTALAEMVERFVRPPAGSRAQ
jgi:hypothetical protein